MSDASRVLLIAPKAPPYGGMALQAARLQQLISADGVHAILQPSNPPFPSGLLFLERARGVRPFLRSILFCAALWRSLKDAEVVHLLACSWAYFFLVVYPAVVLTRLRGKRLIVNYRGGDARRFFNAFGWLSGPVFRMADVVTAPSSFLAELIRSRFNVRVEIIPNILDNSLFRYRERTEFRPRLLVARHLEKMYDVESVLRAFRAVQANHRDAWLWIAGTGPEEAHLRSLATEWKLANVRFLGFVPQAELPAVFDQCDILLNGSRVDNFPGALLEASAAGLVVVSTGAGGIPFIYQNGNNAILVEPGDWQGLALGVETVLQRPSFGLDLTRRALALVRSCDWNHVRKELYHTYGFAPVGDSDCAVSTARVAS